MSYSNARRAKSIVVAWEENRQDWDQKWEPMITNREAEVAKWVIQQDEDQVAYLNKSDGSLELGLNATRLIAEIFINQHPKETDEEGSGLEDKELDVINIKNFSELMGFDLPV